MSNTDTPIKVLLRNNPIPLAAWLLDMQESVINDVCELIIDLLAGVDTVLQVDIKGGSQSLLHIEIQGRCSEYPMALLNNTIVQKKRNVYKRSWFCSKLRFADKYA